MSCPGAVRGFPGRDPLLRTHTAEAMHAKLTVATDDTGAAAVHVIRALIASLRAVVEPRPQLLQARLAGGGRARRLGHRGQ